MTCDGRDTTTSTSTKQIAISGTLNTKNLYIRNYNTTAGIACSFASTATLTIIGDTIVENVKSSSNHAVSCSATINSNGHILFKNNSSTAASSSGVVVSGSNTLSTKNGNLIFKSNSSTQSHGVQILNTVTISGFNTMFIDNIGSGASNSGVFLQSTTLTIARNDLHFHNNVGGDTATDSGVDSDGTLRTKFIHSSAEATNQNISYGGNEYDQYGTTDTTALATARRYTRRRNSATVIF